MAADVKPARALLDRGLHVQRQLAELGELRGEVMRVRDWLANQPADTTTAVTARATARLRELRVQLSEVYASLLRAHQERELPRHTLTDLALWSSTDLCDLVSDMVITTTEPWTRDDGTVPGEPT